MKKLILSAFFWTTQYIFVYFCLGTGKTLLMCEKSKQLARNGECVSFILWTSGTSQKTLLQLSLEKRFRDDGLEDFIKVITSSDVVVSISKIICIHDFFLVNIKMSKEISRS